MIRFGIKNIVAMYEILTLAALVSVFLPVMAAGSMVEGIAIPIHFDLLGRVDAWGDELRLIDLPILALVIWVGFTALQYRELRRSNAPYSVMLRLLKMLSIALLAYINVMSYAVAQGWAEGLNPVFIWALVVAMIAVALYYCILVKIIKKRI